MGSQSEDVSTTETNNISTEETSSGGSTRTDEPVQLIEFVRTGNGSDGNTTIQLKHDTISSLVEKAGNRPLSVICICGPSRQGKSFMLGYMIRCLEAMEKEETDWMDWDDKKKKLEGFKFRNGTQPETQGIWVWSRPFIVKNEDEKEIAVLLIDTQGTYDEFTTNKDMSAIVGLSLLTSSVMVYNMFFNLQEDALASLTTYTSYGQLALDNTNDDSSPFQKLVFLIRDWNNPGEYAYGAKGGKKFLEEKLKVKPDQPPEARQVRESVRKCFKDLDCFLMPQIGEKALYPAFTGSVDELAPNFAKKMEDFINELISSETLIIKEILGTEVTASELVSYLQNYIDIFNSNEVPSAKSMWDASTDVHNSHMVRKAAQKFHDLIKKKLRGNNYLQKEDLEKAKNAAFKQALELFKKARKFGGTEKIQEYQDDLEKNLEKDGKELMKQNEEKRKKYLAGVVTDATVKFRTCLEDDISFDDDGDDSITFYEDNVISRAVQQAKDSAINELKEKLESEDEETINNQIAALLLILDETTSFYENKNKAHRAEAEKKIMGIVDKLSTEFEEKLKTFHEDNPFADNEEVEEYHQTNRTFILECWKKAKKPGKKEFHKEYDAKLDKDLTSISSRFENQHKLKLQETQKEADQLVSSAVEAYEAVLTEKGEHVEMEEELEQIHEEHSKIVLIDFARDNNPYPTDHTLHEELNAKLEGELQRIFEHVKREVIQSQQKMEESYKEAVEHAIVYYEQEMKEILSTSDFMSEEDLQAEHKRIFEEALDEYENFEKIGVPDNALNFKVELKEKLKQRFEEIRANNQRNHELAVSKAANCVSDCHRKYEEFMKPNVEKMLSNDELENLHRQAIISAKEMFFENCPAREDQEFVATYERNLEADIEDTFEELKDLLEMKRDQEESQIKIVIADCRKLYHDEMQKHCKTSSFIRPDTLDKFHEQTTAVVLTTLEKKMPLSTFQKSNLECQMEGMYEKYKQENDMKLNSAKILPPAIGIDLGTTYCCVAVYYNGKVIIIPNQEQGNIETTASYVAYNPDGSKTIGDTAKQNAFKNPETTIYDAKRILGRKMHDPELQRDMKFWPFVVEDDDGTPKININGKLYFPEQVSAELLSEFRIMTEKYLGLESGTISKAVITVPAYFNDGQRQATVDAGELAGLDVLTILNEPTAAAIAYSLERLDNTARKVLIFDLGGGTFDVAVLDVTQSSIEVLGVDGDTHLGGEDFDQKMMEYCALKFMEKEGIDLMDGKDSAVKQERDDARRRLRRLQTYCETAKKNLSSGRTTTVSLDAMFDGVDLKVEITRDKFEELNKAQFEKAIQIVDKALRDTGVRKEHIEDIVLVGGSTRIPKVQDMLKDYFGGKALNYSIHPDKAVAYGAAVKAAMMNGEQAKGKIDFDKIEDVTPMPLGIELFDKTLSVIISKNTKIPIRKKEDYRTAVDNQTNCCIKIYQGEAYIAANNELLGEFVLKGIPSAPKGKEIIDVWMEFDSMGILHVEAICKSTRGSNKLTVTANKQRMSAETKSRLLAEANPDPAA